METPNMNDDCSLIEELCELEKLLAKPGIRRSPTELSRLIADDFREFGSSGRIFDKAKIIAALQQQPPCELVLHDFQAVRLACDIVLVTYRGTVQFSDSPTALHSLRSSIWRRHNSRWQVVFHQGTPSGEAE